VIDVLIILVISVYFAYVLRVSLKKLYPEYQKPPWQASALILALVAFFILLRVLVEYRPSPGSEQTLINLVIFFALTVLFTFAGR
jgi:hypothetical protein